MRSENIRHLSKFYHQKPKRKKVIFKLETLLSNKKKLKLNAHVLPIFCPLLIRLKQLGGKNLHIKLKINILAQFLRDMIN